MSSRHDIAIDEADAVCREVARDYLAPVIVGYIDWFCDKCDIENHDCILLAARAGWLLKQAIAVRNPQLVDRMKYLYVSRASVAPALVEESGSVESFVKLLRYRRHVDATVFTKRFGLSEDECASAAEAAGVSLSGAIDTKTCMDDPKTRRFIEILSKSYSRMADKQRVLLDRYIEQQVVGRSAAFVDIGWNGSTQKALEGLPSTSVARRRYAGYYLGTNEDEATGRYGYLLRSIVGGDDFYTYKVITSILEFVLNAPHGTTLRYEDDGNGRPIPVLAQYEYASIDGSYQPEHRFLLAMHEEIVRYASDAPKNAPKQESEAQLETLMRLLEHPTEEQLRFLGDLRRQDYELYPLAHPNHLAVYLRNPKELMDDFSHAGWKMGFLMRETGTRMFAKVVYRSLLKLMVS